MPSPVLVNKTDVRERKLVVCTLVLLIVRQMFWFLSLLTVAITSSIYRVYQKKLNKPEIALRLCKAPQCTKFFIEIGCLGTDNAV